MFNIDNNNIGPMGAINLATQLTTNYGLSKLYCDSNNIGEDGAEAISECMEMMDSLIKFASRIMQLKIEEL